MFENANVFFSLRPEQEVESERSPSEKEFLSDLSLSTFYWMEDPRGQPDSGWPRGAFFYDKSEELFL